MKFSQMSEKKLDPEVAIDYQMGSGAVWVVPIYITMVLDENALGGGASRLRPVNTHLDL